MKKLEQNEGMRAQLAFEMFYGAKPALRGRTITGQLVFAGYGHDKIDAGVDYIDLSKIRTLMNGAEFDRLRTFLSEDEINYLSPVNQAGVYIKIAKGENDIEFDPGTLVFMDHGIDYLSDSDWDYLNRINLVMKAYGKKEFKWYGQVSHKEKKMLPYMAVYVEADLRRMEFYICSVAESLIGSIWANQGQGPQLN